MSNIAAINATSGLAPSSSSQISNPAQTLNQADFLKLLVTQMTSQDPLNPTSDTQMAAQMAQFSALQASQNTETDIEGLQANALIGQTVTVATTGSPQTGVVSGVAMQTGSEPQIVVNGQLFSLSQLTAIAPPPAATSSSSNTPSTSN